MDTQSKPLLTLTEAAERTGISRETWKMWVNDKTFPSTQPTGPGGKVFVSVALVERILRHAEVEPDWTEPTREVAERLAYMRRERLDAGDPDPGGMIDSGPHITVVGEVHRDVRSDRIEEFLDFVATHPERFRQPRV